MRLVLIKGGKELKVVGRFKTFTLYCPKGKAFELYLEMFKTSELEVRRIYSSSMDATQETDISTLKEVG